VFVLPDLQADGRAGDPPRLRGALRLLQMGLPPVVLRARGETVLRQGVATTATGKEPRFEGFAELALAADEAWLRKTWGEHPDSGVGVLLGLLPSGPGLNTSYWGRPGVVDLEVDDPEAARPVLRRIWPRGVPRTLRFRSNGPGRWHYLFVLDFEVASRLLHAGVSAAVLRGRHTRPDGTAQGDPAYPGLEVRFGSLAPPGSGPVSQCQSVVPPTPRTDGTPRAWKGREVLPFPEELLADLVEHSAQAKAARARAEARAAQAALRDVPIDRDELKGLTPLQKFLHALDRLRIPYSQTAPGEYACSCTAPDHADAKPSLTFKQKEGGGLQITCWSRDCALADIMEGVGLRACDAYPGRYRRRVRPPDRRFSNVELLAPGDPVVSDEEAAAWDEEQEWYAAALDARPELEQELARRLGLPPKALGAVTFGFRERNPIKEGDEWVDQGPAWTWCEYDHRGRAVGINRRFVDPARGKRLIGSRRDDREHPQAVTHRAARGLVYDPRFRARPGTVFIVEGESDFLALNHLGLACVGRPGASAGLREVARLLQGDPREVVVLGERDRKPDGAWPGDPEPVARELARLLGRPVKAVLPPEPYKDAREWLAASLGPVGTSGGADKMGGA
jgi:hypothetical protein